MPEFECLPSFQYFANGYYFQYGYLRYKTIAPETQMEKVQTERLRDYSGPATNTDVWEYFKLRPDDIIVNTPPKCGTTWTLNIVMMLIHGRVVPEAGNREDAPWLDAAFRDRKAIAASQSSLKRRRCVKSHTPMDGIAYGAEPTYIVVYRHPVDVHFSFRTHVENMKDNSGFIDMFPPEERAGFDRFLDGPLTNAGVDDLTISSFVHHYAQAKARQPKGNVHFFHYADLTRDLHGQIARLADILKISVSLQTLDDLTEANTFASMRKVAEA
ncbi:MAG: sulfotransferase domain-containing protein, partial [Sulfitobacter sp.]